MKARRALLVAGSVWELARFFLVLFLFAAVLRAGAWVFPWLLVAGSGSLLQCAGGALLALFPGRYASLLALLRLGKLLSLFAFILLVVSGALGMAAGVDVAGVGRGGITVGAVLVGVFLLDLLYLAVLIRWRSGEEVPAPPRGPGEQLPEYHETEVQNFHQSEAGGVLIVPIGSGKGGVGKSLLAANLSIALAEAGRKVVLVDLDLGASNAHTMLGIRGVTRGIGTFLSSGRTSFEDIVMPTDYEGLSFVPGDAEMPGTASLKPVQKKRLLRCLQALPADIMVLDLGPGAGANPLDFFLLASRGVVVTTPVLTSLLNAYLFLKNVVFRALYASVAPGSGAFAVLEGMRRDREAGLQRVSVPHILGEIQREDPDSHRRIVQSLARLQPRLVLNMVEDPAEVEKAEKLRASVRGFLGIECAHLGVMFRDELQSVAMGSRLPILRYKPGCVLSKALYRIAEKILAAPAETPWAPWTEEGAESPTSAPPEVPGPTVVTETASAAVEASAAEASTAPVGAAAEAQEDFAALSRDLEDLLATGALTMADLVESVRTQQIELTALRKENAALKARLAGPRDGSGF